MALQDLDYNQIVAILTAMDQNGYSTSLKQKLVIMLRTLARYAKGPLKQPTAAAICDILDSVRMETPARRSSSPTRDQIMQIVAEADRKGLHGFATGIMIQWTYALRAVDVRGQWEPIDVGDAGGIIHNGKVWKDGLTWDMFDPDLKGFEKVPSKTRKSLPQPIAFEVTPDIRERLLAIRKGPGPVIVSSKRRPYTTQSWSRTWARIRDHLELPKDLWMMDTRAGAITEGQEAGMTALDLRDAAGHKHVNTTDGYARGRSDAANRVEKARFGNNE